MIRRFLATMFIISLSVHAFAQTDEPPGSDHRNIKGHPVIFTCQDCHPEVAKDGKDRPHGFMRCTACHTFHRENATAGRIMKNGNMRFCLLCHESKPFKDPDRAPQIDVAEHLGEMAEILEVTLESLKSDPRTCLKCHQKHIHVVKKTKK